MTAKDSNTINLPNGQPAIKRYFHSTPSSFKHLPEVLNVMTYNIQVGMNAHLYRHYITQGWRHILPHSKAQLTLNKIAQLLIHQDIIALQEVDAGSLRTRFINQTQYLALQANFPIWHQQINRNLGRLAQHSNGLLSRIKPYQLIAYKLPGFIPGRGALLAFMGNQHNPLVIAIVHLSLTVKARKKQLDYLSELLAPYQHIICMGDFNTQPNLLENTSLVKKLNLKIATQHLKTFPSWKPIRGLDHILYSPTLQLSSSKILNYHYSDHLPVTAQFILHPSLTGKNND